jgi:hypothetical protein
MLNKFIEKNSKNVTTLLSLYVMLDHFRETMEEGHEYKGLPIIEITSRYVLVAEQNNIGEQFYGTYVQRRTKENDLYGEADDRYFLRNAYIQDKNSEEIREFCSMILDQIRESKERYSEQFLTIDSLLIANDPIEIHSYIISLFKSSGFRNYGQIFEVLAFSILKVYFESLGFGLKRFSVSFSNDGGMDYISGHGFYQVTASPSNTKINNDLNKLQGINRVLVLTQCNDTILKKCLEKAEVTEVITSQEIREHFLGWMVHKDKQKPRLLSSVLITIKEELAREIK